MSNKEDMYERMEAAELSEMKIDDLKEQLKQAKHQVLDEEGQRWARICYKQKNDLLDEAMGKIEKLEIDDERDMLSKEEFEISEITMGSKAKVMNYLNHLREGNNIAIKKVLAILKEMKK